MAKNLKEYIDAAENDRNCITSVRKLFTQATTAGVWMDVSMSPGNPPPNFYSGTELEANTLTSSRGIWHGGNVSPASKFLHEVMILTTSTVTIPSAYVLCDYLLYYPQIDMDSTDVQLLINGVGLTRYTDGEGVRAFLVAQYPYTGGATFTVTYTNSSGVSGRSTGTLNTNTHGAIGSIVHSSGSATNTTAAFLPLASGDTGIRSVESIQFFSSNGGLGSLVLVKPLATIWRYEINTPTEVNYLQDASTMPRIHDGAYLNFISLPNGNYQNQTMHATIKTLWN